MNAAPRSAVVVVLLAAACSSPGGLAPAPAPTGPIAIVAAPRPGCEAAAPRRARVPGLLAEGRLDRAVRVIQRADLVCPESAKETWAPLVTTLAELGRADEAAKVADAIDAHPEAPAEARAAARRAREAIASSARKTFDDATRTAMRRVFDAAVGARANQRYAEAKQGFLEAWSLHRPNGQALFFAGLAAKDLGDAAGAQRLFDRAMVEVERETGRAVEPEAWSGLPAGALAAAWSPDAQLLAVAARERVSIRDRRLGYHETIRLEGHRDLVRCLAFSPDGRLLAACVQSTERSPDGQPLPTPIDGTVELWDLATRTKTRSIPGSSGGVYHATFSPDGRRIAGSSGKAVRLWSVATGVEERSLEGHTETVTSLAFSPDGKTLASGSRDNTIRLWDVARGTLSRSLTGAAPHPTEEEKRRFSARGEILAIAFSPDGKTLASGGTAVRTWGLGAGGVSRVLDTHDLVDFVAFSPDGATVISGGGMISGTGARLWSVATGSPLRTIDVASAAGSLSPDGEILASTTAGDWSVRLTSTTTGATVGTILAPSPIARYPTVSFSPNGETVAWRSNAMRVWSADAGAAMQKSHLDLWPLALSPDGRTVAAGEHKTVTLRTLATGTVLRKLEGHTGGELSLAFSPDGQAIAAGSAATGKALAWSLATGDRLLEVRGRSVAFSPDGKTLATGAFGEVHLTDVATGTDKRTMKGHQGPVDGVAFSPDGATLASAGWDRSVRLWSVATGAELRKLEGHTLPVSSVTFSPDGRALASGSAMEKAVRLWDVATGAETRKLDAPTDTVWTRAGEPILVLAAFQGPIGYAIAKGPVALVEPLGPDAVGPNVRPVCRAGALTFPFDLCRERCEAHGLLAKALAGGSSYADPE